MFVGLHCAPKSVSKVRISIWFMFSIGARIVTKGRNETRDGALERKMDGDYHDLSSLAHFFLYLWHFELKTFPKATTCRKQQLSTKNLHYDKELPKTFHFTPSTILYDLLLPFAESLKKASLNFCLPARSRDNEIRDYWPHFRCCNFF